MIRTWRVSINGWPAFSITGKRDAIMDMAYDNGALGVTIIEEKAT